MIAVARGAGGLVLLFFVASLLSCGVVVKPKAPNRVLELRTKGSFFEASNGYVFAILDDESSRLARVDVRYPVGSADDPPGKEGLAHLVEHLMFEYAIERRGKLSSIFAESGYLSTYFNAHTTLDYIHFESQGLPDSLPELLALEAQRAASDCKSLSPGVFEREKEVVLNELRQRLGADGGDLYGDISKALYGEEHPYGRLGSLQSVGSISIDDVCAFIDTTLREGKAMVVVSGAVEPAKVRQMVASTFAFVPKRDTHIESPVSPGPVGASKTNLRADVAEPVLLVAWPMPPEGSLEYRLVSMARPGLERAMSGFAYEYGWGHSIETWIAGGGEAPHLVLSATLRSAERMAEAESFATKAVTYALRQVASPGDKSGERYWQLRLAKLEAALISRYENLGERAQLFCDEYQYRERKNFLVEALKEMREATPEKARAAADKWLARGRAKVIRIRPHETVTSGRKVASVLGSAHDSIDKVRVDEGLADLPAPLPTETGLALRTHRYEVSNGLDVVLWPLAEMPLAHARLVVSSGRAMEPAGQEGLSFISGFDDIYEDSMVYWDRRASTLIDLLIEDVTLELRNPGNSVSSKQRRHLKSRLKVQGWANRSDFVKRMRTALWGEGHPYARDLLTAASIDKMTSDRAKTWARKHIVPENSTLVLAGTFDIPLVKKWIAYLSDQVSPGREAPALTAGAPRPRQAWIGGVSHDRPTVVEVDIRFVGRPGIDTDHATREVIAGIIESKLAELRAENAITYGFSARYVPQEQAGYWQILGYVDAARAEEAGALVQRSLNELRSGRERYRSEFVLARRKALNALLASASDSGAVIERLEYIVRFGLSDAYFDLLAKRIAHSTLKDVEELIADELSSDSQVTGAYGQNAPVAAFLKGAQESQVYVARKKRREESSASGDRSIYLSEADGRLSASRPRIRAESEGWDFSSMSSASTQLSSGGGTGEEELESATEPGLFPDLDWQRGRDQFKLQLSYDGSRSDDFLDAVDIYRLLLFGEASLSRLGLPRGSLYGQFARSSRTVAGTSDGEDHSAFELGGAARMGRQWLARVGVGFPLNAVQGDERAAADVSSQHRNADAIFNQASATTLRLSASRFGNRAPFFYRLDGGLDAAFGLFFDSEEGPETTFVARLNAGVGFNANAVHVGLDTSSSLALVGDAYRDEALSVVASPHAGVRLAGYLIRIGFLVPVDSREVAVSLGLSSD